MATAYLEVRGFIRSALGDLDTNVATYSDAILNSQINYIAMLKDDVAYTGDGTTSFTGTLTNNQKAILTLRAAINLIAPKSDTFSHRGPNLAIHRSGGQIKHYNYLREQLSRIEAGLVIETENELDALVTYPLRLLDDFQDALGKLGDTNI